LAGLDPSRGPSGPERTEKRRIGFRPGATVLDFLSPLLGRPLLFFLPFFLAGLALGPDFSGSVSWLWPSAGLLIVLSGWLIWRNRGTGWLVLGLAFGLIGLGAGAEVFSPPAAPHHVYHLQGQTGLVFGGRIAEPPEVEPDRARLIIEADEVLPVGGRSRSATGRIHLTVLGHSLEVQKGQRVRFPAELREISNFENPGRFDYRRYLAGQGLWTRAFLRDPRLLAAAVETEGFRFDFINRFRSRALKFLDQVIGQPARGLIKALLLGRRGEIEPEIVQTFRRLGLAHLLAISGLHVGLVALAAYWVFLKILLLNERWTLRFNLRRLAAVLALGPVLFYAGLAGGRPSTLRAAVMVSVFLLAQLIEKTKDYLSALALAAWIILVLQPGAVFTPAFQLSFAAAAAIIILVPRFPATPLFSSPSPDQDSGPRKPLGRFWGLAVISTAALIGTAPIVAWHFNRLSLWSLPANMIFTPLLSLGLIPAGLLALVLMPVFPLGTQIIFQAMERFLWLALPSMEALAAVPGAEVLVPRPSPAVLAGYYFIVAAVFLVRPWKRAALAAGLVVLTFGLGLTLVHLGETSRPELKVTVLDVGQGQAVCLVLPDGTRMMIDAGGFPGSDFDTGEFIVGPYLLNQGVRRLDILALSHPQADHVGGLPYLARTFGPTELWTNGSPSENPRHRELLDLARQLGLNQPDLIELHRPRQFGAATVTALAPAPDYLYRPGRDEPWRDQNNNSLVLKVAMGRTSFLFPGDLEEKGEAEIVRRQGERLRADVLLAPHHGGKTSLTPAFLEAVRPKIVIFSAGRDNRFGFPSPEALGRVRAVGAKIYRTDRHGAVTCVTDGERVQINSFLE